MKVSFKQRRITTVCPAAHIPRLRYKKRGSDLHMMSTGNDELTLNIHCHASADDREGHGTSNGGYTAVSK